MAPGIPQRGGAPQVQGALLQQIAQASTDIHATTGIEPASLGNSPELKSGKAIIAQQKMGDRGSFIFSDNLVKSVEYSAEILIDLIPKIYDTQRIIKVVGADGSVKTEEINTKALNDFNETIKDEQTGKEVIVNDLSDGKYSVSASTGVSYNTQREETAQQLMDLVSSSPTFERLGVDLLAKNLDMIESDVLHKRIRKQMIQEGLIEPTEEEIKELGLDQPQEPDPGEQALVENVQMQTAKLQADIENKDADTQQKLINTQQATINSYKTLIDAYKSQLEVGIPLGKDEREMMKDQQGLIEVMQEGSVT